MSHSDTREAILRVLHEVLPVLQTQYGIRRLALYGSFAKESPTADSDVDLLVELSRPLGLDFVHLAEQLEAKLGRPVDLATFESLKRSGANPRRARLAANIERTLIYVE